MMRWPASLLLLLLLLAACEARGAATGGAPRIVSLHDVTTELVVALGATDRLVGVEDPVDVSSDTTAALARVPRVGDLETILAARPTLVVGLHIVAARDPELVARLREAGVDTYFADPTTLDDVYAMIRAVGVRIGSGTAGDQLARRMTSEAAEVAPPATTVRRTRVFVYDCCDPPFTAGGKTVLGDLIARAGGENVFGDVAAAWTHVSWEEVLARRPELVVIDAYAYAGQGEIADKQRAVRAISALAGLPTVTIPLRNSLGGIHSIEGLARLRAAIRSGS
jgi:ABC-type Fe3+-hydroxamate transport system substrate-binding protein